MNLLSVSCRVASSALPVWNTVEAVNLYDLHTIQSENLAISTFEKLPKNPKLDSKSQHVPVLLDRVARHPLPNGCTVSSFRNFYLFFGWSVLTFYTFIRLYVFMK